MGWLLDGYQNFWLPVAPPVKLPANQISQLLYQESYQRLKIGLSDFYQKDDIRSNVSRRENEKQLMKSRKSTQQRNSKQKLILKGNTLDVIVTDGIWLE